MNLDLLLGVVIATTGAVFGSGVTALAWRLPRGESWVQGRSKCPGCGHVLGPLDLVPVLSWAFAGGRCRHCASPVSIRYPATELWCAAWAVLAWRHEGLTPAFGCAAFWGFLLVALVWIDLDFQLLPDALTIPGTLLAVAAAALDHRLVDAAWGMVAGAGLLFIVAEGYFRLRKIEGMGFGDVKLAAMFGAMLGPGLAILAIFVGAFSGSIVGVVLMARGRGGMKTALPFGVFLAPAAMAVWLWGAPVLATWLHLLRP